MKYRIADYMTPEQKALAMSVEYNVPLSQNEGNHTFCDAEGYCPMGRAISGDAWTGPMPTPGKITRVLTGNENYDPNSDPVYEAALSFVSAWDRGRITDLAEALGVDKGDGGDAHRG